ncbi:hypothetical protein VP1G_10927 [Cytospora mali]|uniref:Uncharacterized protein n=1 Tax=Cytospora mali TaxID=578113 RepID=A0A194UZP7_CYTMA|nr:hypothetical protein VP1G_10927 [Valsa mali var. pyri (nom. inval.)]
MSYEGACLAAFNDKEECSGATRTHLSRTASAGIRDQLAAIAVVVAVAVADIAMTGQVLDTSVVVY